MLTFVERTDRALSFFGIFKFIALVGLVVLMAYLTTRLVSKGYMRGLKSGEFELIDKLILSPDKSLALVKLIAEDKYYLLAMDKAGLHVIDKLDHMELRRAELGAALPLEKRSFKDILNKLGGDKK